MPRVSVLMPVYNTLPDHLRNSIDSILGQTFADFELIILNDGSSDPSVEEIARSYSDPRIRYSSNERNLGISGSRNRLLDMARGEYAAIMDHDDISMPERLERQVAFLDSHQDVGIVGTLAENMEGRLLRECPSDDIAIKKMLMVHCNLSHSSCMLRLSVLRKFGIRYEELFTPAEDYALFASLIPVTKFAVIQERLFRYRTWEGNTSNRRAKAMEAAKEGVQERLRRTCPEIWEMAESCQCRRWRYRFLGVPVLTRKVTKRKTVWLLFEFIPLWTSKQELSKIMGI